MFLLLGLVERIRNRVLVLLHTTRRRKASVYLRLPSFVLIVVLFGQRCVTLLGLPRTTRVTVIHGIGGKPRLNRPIFRKHTNRNSVILTFWLSSDPQLLYLNVFGVLDFVG